MSGGVSPGVLRRICAAWPSGVAVVTSVDHHGHPVGMAVSSFTSVSLDPPLVLFCADHTSSTWAHIAAVGRFAVNVLAADQERLARSFALSGTDKFAGVAWQRVAGLPRLAGTAAVLECELHVVHRGGDHAIALGLVCGAIRHERPPLVFHDGSMGGLAPRLAC